MSSAPAVSVVVRTKDRPRLLAEALACLRAQTFRDFEAVVVNDGGAPPALDEIGAPARVVETEPPHGRSRALNAGLKAAQGRFVAYLDDDDLWLPNHLETLARFLSGTDSYRGAYTDVRVVLQALGEDGRYRDERTIATYDRPFSRARLLSSNTIPLIGLMHDRALALEIGGYDESFDLFEDWEFLVRLTERTRLHRLPGVTAVYRLRDDGSNATTEHPWRSPRSDAARVKLFAKHWASHSPETQAGLVDALVEEAERARAEALALRQNSDVERQRFAAEAARLTRERDEAQRAANEAALVRADAARQLQAAGERETALRAQLADAGARLDAVHRSLAWRLFTPWWKLKSLLSR